MKKRDWIWFSAIALIIVGFLVLRVFTMKRVVPFEEAMEHISLVDGEKAVTVHMNCTKGVIYAYNDGQFDTGETDNIYVVFMQSLFDRWFGYDLPGFRQVVIHKSGDDVSGYTAPKIWYIEDITYPNVRKTAFAGYIIK